MNLICIGSNNRDKENVNSGQGVGLMENDNDDYVEIIYLNKHVCGVGVRKDDILYQHINMNRNILLYNKPCVCGSLSHRTSNDPKCVLSAQYTDAI